MIGLTTGRQTSQRMNSLLKELAQSIPNAKIIRRGKSSLNELTATLLSQGITHTVAIHRWHGSPGRISLFSVQPNGVAELKPSMILSAVKLKREYGTRGKYVIGGITHGEVNEATRRFARALSTALEVPLITDPQGKTATFNLADIGKSFVKLVVTAPLEGEVGPSLTISRLLWDDGSH